MVLKSNNSQKRGIGTKRVNRVKGVKRLRHDKTYWPATLRNRATGERETVELFDPQNELNERLLRVDTDMELRMDLKAALRYFTRFEQRMLYRVLVQGQSVREAFKFTVGNLRSKEIWAQRAIADLRNKLKGYAGRVRGVQYNPQPSPSSTVKGPPVVSINCRFKCGWTTEGHEGAVMKALHAHASECHREYYVKVKRYASENNHGTFMMERELT